MKHFILGSLCFVFLFHLLSPQIYASSYVLPYPSYMPGNIMYKVVAVFDVIEKYWSFGTFNQISYNLKKSDKFLVESKTLFEYQQYDLALHALHKSSMYFQKIKPLLKKAEKEGKDISEKKKIVQAAREKHNEVLSKLLNELPENYYWANANVSKKLFLHDEIKEAVKTTHE